MWRHLGENCFSLIYTFQRFLSVKNENDEHHSMEFLHLLYSRSIALYRLHKMLKHMVGCPSTDLFFLLFWSMGVLKLLGCYWDNHKYPKFAIFPQQSFPSAKNSTSHWFSGKKGILQWIAFGPACQYHLQKVCVADAEIVSV